MKDCYFFPFKSLFIYFERERVGERGREEETDRVPSGLHGVRAEPDAGLKPTDCEIVT